MEIKKTTYSQINLKQNEQWRMDDHCRSQVVLQNICKKKKKQKQHVTRAADTKINETEHKSHI